MLLFLPEFFLEMFTLFFLSELPRRGGERLRFTFLLLADLATLFFDLDLDLANDRLRFLLFLLLLLSGFFFLLGCLR